MQVDSHTQDGCRASRTPGIRKSHGAGRRPSTCGSIRSAWSTGAWSSRSRVLSFTGYYIHDPFIVGQVNHPFLMGWFRFVHETFGMLFIALFLLRMYLFFGGNRWVRWRQYVPLRASAVQGNVGGDEVLRVHQAQADLEDRPQRHGGVLLPRHLQHWCSSRSSPDW